MAGKEDMSLEVEYWYVKNAMPRERAMLKLVNLLFAIYKWLWGSLGLVVGAGRRTKYLLM